MNKTLMNTIENTYKRCQEENIGLSKHYIRYLCINDIIPTCKIGVKYLINWNVLMDYLNGTLNYKSKEKKTEEPIKNKIRCIY